jgi:hypothetical protein
MAKDEELKVGMRVRDLRLRDYGDGTIENMDSYNSPYYPAIWEVRWDDGGLDNEAMKAKDLGVISGIPRS